MQISNETSNTISTLRFFLIFLIIILHATWGSENSEYLKFDLDNNPCIYIQTFFSFFTLGVNALFFLYPVF